MNRRGFLTGLVSALAAPAIVRAELLMPVRSIVRPEPFFLYSDHGLTLGDFIELRDLLIASHVPPGPDGNYYYVVSSQQGGRVALRASPPPLTPAPS